MTDTVVAEPRLTHRQTLTILSGLLLGVFLAALDQNIVSVAIVRIANSLDGFDEQAWATTAYLITATVTTPLYGKLADIYGRKPFYLLAIALFVIGSAACCFATTMYQLAACRAFQGLGAGGLMSLAFTIVGDIVPARERVRYQGYFLMVFGIATVLGPVVGGFLSEYESLGGIEGWRWVFLVNVPVGVLAFLVVARVLNVGHIRRRSRIDWLGALTLVVAVVPLLLVAEQGRVWGWTSPKSLLCYGIGAGGLVLFLIVEFFMKDAALIPLRLFRSSTFSIAILGGFLVGVAMFGAITMVPQYLQVVRGFSPTEAGLLMLPLVLGIMVGAHLSGLITKASGRYKVLPVLGALILAIGCALFAHVGYDGPLWQPLAYSAIMGFGLGGCMQTLIIAAQNAVPSTEMGVSTASATFFRQLGGTLGVAVFLTVLFDRLPGSILSAFGGSLPAGLDAAGLDALQRDTSGIAALPDELRMPILAGFTDAMQGVFLLAADLAIVACLVMVFMKEIPLREDPAPEEGSDGTLLRDVSLHDAHEMVDHLRPAATGRVIAGLLRRDDARPVPAAILTLIDQHGHQVARGNGDADGAYVIAAPQPGNYVLIAAAAGHQPEAVSVSLGERALHVDLMLTGAGELTGTVRSARRGEPLFGATVTLTDPEGDVVGAAITGEDGVYVCRDVVSGTYTLVAVADHMRPSAVALTVPETGSLHHDIDLEPMAILVGSAWVDGDRPVADVQITVLAAGGDPAATTRTDEKGRYLVPDLPEGEYTVVARGYPPVASQVSVTRGEITHDVTLGYDNEESMHHR
ncbi:MFS transporter [Nocardia rhizosphaerihabitans]|uniref:alpha-amylase n=1 Tax=Nocardia rhizosphaerihabitans TaxID=1691570 RepID=A0ABQ2K603_9NOCA|nr:MFS transporter [Nocardia rhizosphaerihabitans]GGN66973.1 MFS transporter [Nocardia rhizosphaerihabitans]